MSATFSLGIRKLAKQSDRGRVAIRGPASRRAPLSKTDTDRHA
jgi:hypothetical protein